ncbi:methyltransferase [Streptomyces sp. NPDC041068]|uniref:methyltransferase n=1 Tax=Streptomyces sp. NPDC041068 TaxID=3155130 RepID=UPI0033F5D8CD
MLNEFSYDLGQWDISRFRERPPQDTFTAFDLEWHLLPDVWPGNAVATKLFTSWLPYSEVDSFLEVGCGAGVTAVIAAMRGCSRVCALDINPAAAETAQLNATRHGVGDKVTTLTSDLFSALDEGTTFDLIYWNSPFVEAPVEHEYRSQIDYAAFDADYKMHEAFFAALERHMSETTRVFLGFSETLGNPQRLHELAARSGFTASVYRRDTFDLPADYAGPRSGDGEGDGLTSLVYVLYEFRRTAPAA